jgi:hypothetical protein
MPGWGIVVDLTPPELIASRHLKVLRMMIVAGLVAILALCAGGYVLAARKHSAAASALSDVQARTTELQAEAAKYAGITKIQGTVGQMQGQIAKLMGNDVDVVKLMARIRTDLPESMTISQETATITAAGTANGGTAKPGVGLDASGHLGIGTVTISGAGRSLDDLPMYVDKLAAIPGVVDVVPLSNVADDKGVQYSVSLSLTDELLSHRFDASTNGSK